MMLSIFSHVYLHFHIFLKKDLNHLSILNPLILEFSEFFTVLDMSPLSDIRCVFSSFLWVVFLTFLTLSFAHKFLILMKSNISIALIFSLSFLCYTKKPGSQRFTPVFSSKSFIILALAFWPMVYFVYDPFWLVWLVWNLTSQTSQS